MASVKSVDSISHSSHKPVYVLSTSSRSPRLAWLALLFCVSASVSAQAPDQVAFQGLLFADGKAVDNAGATIIFSLYNGASSGTALWTETQTGVPVINGQFVVYLGSVTSLAGIPFDVPYWVGVTYQQVLLSPRSPLVSVPYARTASNAASAPWTGITGVPSGFADGVDNTGSAASKRNCRTYVVPYMPYSNNASQIMYLSRVPVKWVGEGSTTGDITVKAYDEQGRPWDLGTVGTAGMGVTKVASLIGAKLQTLGFNGGKLTIGITVGNPQNVFAYASYNAGSIRGFVDVECIR